MRTSGGSYGEKQPLFVLRRANTWPFFEGRGSRRADEHARNGGYGELGRLFVFGNKCGTQDNLGVRPDDPHVAWKLELNVSWKRIPSRYTTERTAWW